MGQKVWKINSRFLIYCSNSKWKILKLHGHDFKHLKSEIWQQYLSNLKLKNYFGVKNVKNFDILKP